MLLTDYTNGNFYCSDPAGNISSGRIPLENSSVSVNRSSCYWYVASDHNFIAAEADGLRLEGMSYPINVRAGKGMALTGTANAALVCSASRTGERFLFRLEALTLVSRRSYES